jgi:drug/metabolite transporter (DMT)-like permease
MLKVLCWLWLIAIAILVLVLVSIGIYYEPLKTVSVLFFMTAPLITIFAAGYLLGEHFSNKKGL